MDKSILAMKCALADLAGIMPEFEPSGDRVHPGWKTIVDLYDALMGLSVDVSEWENTVESIRLSLG